MTFENRKRLAIWYKSLGQNKHPYFLEMKDIIAEESAVVEDTTPPADDEIVVEPE